MEIGAAHYIKAVPLGNFRRAWEETDPESELSDDYGLGNARQPPGGRLFWRPT